MERSKKSHSRLPAFLDVSDQTVRTTYEYNTAIYTYRFLQSSLLYPELYLALFAVYYYLTCDLHFDISRFRFVYT